MKCQIEKRGNDIFVRLCRNSSFSTTLEWLLEVWKMYLYIVRSITLYNHVATL